jgi:hypothetical protein
MRDNEVLRAGFANPTRSISDYGNSKVSSYLFCELSRMPASATLRVDHSSQG